jgi:hypothetical protein
MYQVIFVSCDQYLSFTHSALNFPTKETRPFSTYLLLIFSDDANPDNIRVIFARWTQHYTIGFSPPTLLYYLVTLV